MKNIKKIILCVLCCYLVIGLIWIGKIYIVHQLHIGDLPILGYHSVASDEEKEAYHSNNIYVMAASVFEEQMQYLFDNGYITLTMEEIEQYYNGEIELPNKAVALTFDDGFENFNTIIKPILESYNFHGTAFIIGRKTELDDSNNPSILNYLKQEQLVSDETMAYYSHTYNLHRKSKTPYHKYIETASLEEIREDFQNNKNIVSDRYFAFPYGISSDTAEQVLKEENVSLAFGYNQNRNMNRKDNRYLLPRYSMFASMPFWYFTWITET